MKSRFLDLFMVLLSLVAVQALCVSCSSEDEPDGSLVDYYLALESSDIIGLSEEDLNGSLRPPQEQSAYVTYLRMKKALRDAYPTASANGNDGRVIAVCDSCFRESIFYYEPGRDIICTVRLMRTTQSGKHIIKSRQLTSYKFKRYSLSN